MKANKNDNPLRIRQITKRFKRPNGQTIDGYDQRTDLHQEDGWREVIIPAYNSGTHHLGSLKISGDDITYVVSKNKVKTPEEIAQGILDDIKTNYQFHKENGWEAYQDFRAKIIVDISEGTIDEAQAFMIESVLSVAYDRIANTGDWKTAYFLLNQVSGFDPFVEAYYDQAIIDIAEYIQINYDQ